MAVGAQVTDVHVFGQGYATTVAIYANGDFTHTEYRPADNLLMVDLMGVSAAKWDGKMREVHGVGLQSYRVVASKAPSGSDVARLECNLTPGAVVDITEADGALLVKVTGHANSASTPAEKPSAVAYNSYPAPVAPARLTVASSSPAVASSYRPRAVAAAPPADAAVSARPSTVKDVTIARGENGINVEVTGTGPMTPKVLTLTGPDRIVLDIMNARLAIRPHDIPVNSGDVKTVRMSRYQLSPPTTRIVVDLLHAEQYQITNTNGKLVLKLNNSKGSAASATEPTVAAVTPVKPYSAPPTPRPYQAAKPAYQAPRPYTASPAYSSPSNTYAKASDVVVVQPVYHTKTETPLSNSPVAMASASSMRPDTNATRMQDASTGVTAMMQTSGPLNTVTGSSCASGRYTGEPISVNLKDVDLRDFFRLIHDVSGLNVVLDPAVAGRLTIVLDDVPWDQALNIVLKNNALDCQLEGNVLRIATVETLRREAEARLAQQTAQSLAVDKVQVTRYLYYASAKDTVPTLKQFLSPRGDIVADERTNSLIISDIPSSLPNVDRLLKELDRKTQQVEIEARVVAATRNFARDIGTQLAFGFGNKATAIGGNGNVGNSTINQNPANPFLIGAMGAAGQIPLFSNFPAAGATSGLSLINAGSNYRLDAFLTLAESRGLLKILSRPRVVTQNNVNALVRQGLKVPFITRGQLSGPDTVTFIDAFLRLSVKPQITRDGTIFLNVDVENTVADFGRVVRDNPTLITQQATTQVLVTDGGTVVIGGVIQTTNSVNIQQVPLLGNIPILGNLFKRRAVSTSTQELIFFITPKIIET